MNGDNKGSRIIAVGILIIMVCSLIYGYRTLRRISPKADERLNEIGIEARDKVEDYFGIDVTKLSDEDKQKANGVAPAADGVTGDDGEGSEPQYTEPSAGEKSYDYTYNAQNTRSYDGPKIYQMNGLIFNTDGKVIRKFLGNKTYYLEMNKNVDGSEAVLLHEGTCYYIDADLNMTEIAKNVSAAGMCYNGGYFFYITEGENYATTTYIYSVKDKREWEISRGHAKFGVISPDGRTVALFDYHVQPQLRIGGIDIEEITVSLDKRMEPISVSDDGDTVFYNSLDDEDGIFCYNRNKTTKITREHIYEGFLDRECKQILFEQPGGILYFKAGDTSAAKLTATSHYKYDFSAVSAAQISPFRDIYILDTDSFAEAVMIHETKSCFCLVEDTPELYDMMDEENHAISFSCSVTEEGPACVYADRSVLIRKSFDGKELSEKIIYTDPNGNRVEFACSDDLSEIWYKIGGNLYYSKDGSDPLKVASECGNELKYSSYDGKCYYIKSGVLHRVGDTPDSDEVVNRDCKKFKFFPGELNVVGFTDNNDKDYIVLGDNVGFSK